jgi:thiol-disulfide isomerase/thioredoxin
MLRGAEDANTHCWVCRGSAKPCFWIATGCKTAAPLTLLLPQRSSTHSLTLLRCGPCKRLRPELVRLSEEHPDSTLFVLVDVDKCKEVSRAQSIACMPTVKAYLQGKCVETLEGATAAAVAALIKKHS